MREGIFSPEMKGAGSRSSTLPLTGMRSGNSRTGNSTSFMPTVFCEHERRASVCLQRDDPGTCRRTIVFMENENSLYLYPRNFGKSSGSKWRAASSLPVGTCGETTNRTGWSWSRIEQPPEWVNTASVLRVVRASAFRGLRWPRKPEIPQAGFHLPNDTWSAGLQSWSGNPAR